MHFFKSDLRFFLDCSNALRDVWSGEIAVLVVVVLEDGSVDEGRTRGDRLARMSDRRFDGITKLSNDAIAFCID